MTPIRWLTQLGRPHPRDAVAGLVTGLFSIPEGMAYASIGGFNPVAGLYSGMVPTLVGSFAARTVLMVTTLTSAIALSSHSVLKEAGLDPSDPANVAALALWVGVVMGVLGLLRAGSIMNFVSNAVMTGFTTGIAVQIVAGVVKDATGYTPTSGNTLGKIGQAIGHADVWDGPTLLVSGATIGVWAVFRFIRPLASLATLISLVIVTVVVTITDTDVEKVGDIAKVPEAFPSVTGPHWSALPHLALGALAVSLVGLAQAAGISAAVPNPDRSRPSASGDFLAQGVANVAGSAFGALPTGGSLSRTGVAVSAGARGRWAGIFAGIWLIVIVVLVGSVAERIPMPVIGGLVMVIGVELIVGRLPDIVLVAKTAPLSTVAMIVTFAATTGLPLQQAILIGAVISLLLFCIKAAQRADLVALEPTGDDRWQVAPVPEVCPSGAVTVLHYAGIGLFAEVPRLDEKWPTMAHTRNAVLILSMRTVPDVPSSVAIKALRARALGLRERHSKLMIVGVDPDLKRTFDRSGLTAILGEDNLLIADDQVFGALDRAFLEARAWIADRSEGTGSEGAAS